MEEIIDTRPFFDSPKKGQEELEIVFQKYEARGFQRWQPPVVLTRFKFTSEARFVAVENKTVDQAIKEIVDKAHQETGLWWQGEAVVELIEQNQKKAHVFLRNKFGPEALKELAEELYTRQKDKNEGRGVSCVRDIADALSQGDFERAKAICFNEGDKFDGVPDIRETLEDRLFAPDEGTPWDLFKKK